MSRRADTPVIHVHWVDRGYEPTQPPNPAYPNGIDIDMTGGDRLAQACKTSLPYPAKRVGFYVVTCPKCHMKTIFTTAGPPDDPKSVKLACKHKTVPQAKTIVSPTSPSWTLP